MQDTIEQILSYVYGLWRYRWLIMILAWVIAPIGWVVVSKIPDRYESMAQVYVDTDTILRPLLKGLSVDELDPSEQFGLMAKELLGRPNLESVVREVDLDIHAVTDVQMERLIQKLEKNIKIKAKRASQGSSRRSPPNLYILSAQHEKPETAYRIVQALLDTFVEGSLSGKRAENIAAQKFLDKEIEEYEARLIDAETRLREFRKKNIKLLPEQGSSYYQRLQAVQTNLESVELELSEEKHRRQELLRQLKNISQMQHLITEDGVAILSPIDQRIMALQSRLDELLLTYTEEHPDVSEAKSSLKELKSIKQAELESAQQDGSGAGMQNPLNQQIRLALGEAEANIAAIKVRRDEYRKRVRDLQKQVETLPQVEAELQALNRDYDINRENYDALVSRREAAKMGAAVEQTGERVKIKVIEPPRVPLFPSSPDRLSLTSIILLLAIAAGAGAAFLLSQIKMVFYNQKSVRDVLGLPVIGSVSYSIQDVDLRKKRVALAGYISTGSLLVILYLGVMYFHYSSLAQ